MLDRSTLPLAEGELIGGRYRLRAPLGAGGMGWVFLATDTTLEDQQVALKFLYPHLLNDSQSFSRFRNEVLVARKLIHPNIVRTFNMGIDVGQAYIVMEYIRGQTLKSSNLSQGNSPDRALAIALDICRGVAHSHALGIIHRDLKPDNVLLTDDGQVKLSDFGLAATLRRQGNFTKVGQLLGTPYYMAPEQFRGSQPDERSDIYAFGILLYELVFGCVPFQDSSLYGLASKHATEPIAPPANAAPPTDLWEVIKRATHKQPSSRFSNCDELKAELEKLVGETSAPIDHGGTPSMLRQSVADAPAPYEIRRTIRRSILPFIFLFFAIGIPWVRNNASARTRVVCAFLLAEKYTGQTLDPLYRIFGVAPEFKNAPLALLLDSDVWPRVFVGEDPDAPQNRSPIDGSTILHVAANNSGERLVRYLLKHGASPSATALDGRTPLHAAVSVRDTNIARILLDEGVDPNPRLTSGTVPLHIAVQQRDLKMIELLLSRGADPLLKDQNGWSPAMYAVSTGDRAIIDSTIGSLTVDRLPLNDLKLAEPRANLVATRAYFTSRFGVSPF